MKKGFTLIELLVVVLIIGILAAVALPQYQKAVWRSRFATLKELTKNIANAEEAYYLANGEYTNDLDSLSVGIPNGISCTKETGITQCTFPWGVLKIVSLSQYIEADLYKDNAKYISYQINLDNNTWASIKSACITSKDYLADQICKAETGKTLSGEEEKGLTGNSHSYAYQN